MRTMPLRLWLMPWTLLPLLCLLLPHWALFPWTHPASPPPQVRLRHPLPWTCMTQARSLIMRVSGTACFMFLAVNLTRVMSTWVFLHLVVTCPPDPVLKMGGPSNLRIPASHLLVMAFVMHLSIPPPPLQLVLIFPPCPIQREFVPCVSPR
jgi:hypothetical protein